MRPETAWHFVLPVKGGADAKSRLGIGDRAPALALAMAMDCLEAVLATPQVQAAVIVTDDGPTAAAARRAGARVTFQSSAGLAGAIEDGLGVVTGPTAVLLADLPCLTPDDLTAALHAIEQALVPPVRSVFVPDADQVGTVLLAACRPDQLAPAFGGASAQAHERGGAARLELPLPRLRRDVDTIGALRSALALGVGRRTAATLPDMQTTVLTFDRATGEGTVVTDAGVVLDLAPDALAGSGLRHLRPGQRVSCVLVPGPPDTVTAVHIHGIGD